MSKEYVENLINDLKAIEFGKDYIINGNELYELKDYLINVHKQIDQLTNNWNELEEDINNKIKDIKTNFSQVNGNYFNMNYVIDAYEEVLDKMNEIKEGNNDN